MASQPSNSGTAAVSDNQEGAVALMEECCYRDISSSSELQILFSTKFGEPVSFSTYELPSLEENGYPSVSTSFGPVNDAYWREKVERAIKNNGGSVCETNGPHTVWLVPTPKFTMAPVRTGMDPPYNTFSVQYIWDCIKAKAIKSLAEYWIHQLTDFDNDVFDPTGVMLGEFKWQECLKPAPSRISYPRIVDPEMDALFYDNAPTRPAGRPRHPRSRVPYQYEERVAILKFIKEVDGYGKVNGNALWKEMEKAKVVPQRTWQSLKEHFRKQIVNNLDQYPHRLTKKFKRQ